MIKSTQTTITYANRTLISPGGHFDGDAISDSLETTAQTVELVNARFKRLEEHKNVSVSRNFSFVKDFDSVEAAFEAKLQSEAHANSNAIGKLKIQVGNFSRTYEAALTRLDAEISLSVNSVRLVLRYSFTTGKETS